MPGMPSIRSSAVTRGLELLAIEDLELDQVQVDGVRVGRRVDDLPDLGRAQRRQLGHRIVPLRPVEQRLERSVRAHHLVEGEPARAGRAGEPGHVARAGRGDRALIGPGRRHHAELHDLPRRLRIDGLAVGERGAGVVAHHEAACRARSPRSRSRCRRARRGHDEPPGIPARRVVEQHGRVEVAAVRADLPEARAGDVRAPPRPARASRSARSSR